MSSDSLGAHSGKPESADYDSGARDLSPEPLSLTLLMKSHDPSAVREVQNMGSGQVLDLADRLHLAAITSMKGEINELKTRLQQVCRERDMLDRQVNMSQSDTLCTQREVEARVEQVTARYEERIIELHSVIAELRKKLERHHINVIREEEEFEESDAAQSNRSQDGGSNHDNLADSHSASLEMGKELSLELSRVVTEMESAMAKHSPLSSQLAHDHHHHHHHRHHSSPDKDVTTNTNTNNTPSTKPEIPVPPPQKGEDEEYDDEEEEESEPPPTPPPRQALSPLKHSQGHSGPGGPPQDDGSMSTSRVGAVVVGSAGGGDPLGGHHQHHPHPHHLSREAELSALRSQLLSVQAERDLLQSRVWELENSGVMPDIPSSPVRTPTHTQTRTHNSGPAPAPDNKSEAFPVAKMAELKKLRTLTGDRQALGAEVSSLGLPSTRTAEHLVQSFQVNSSTQELALTLSSHPDPGADLDLDPRLVEYRLELDRVQSRADHLRAQNDTLALTLCESKAHAERLSTLVGKYESNVTALTLALSYSDQGLEACQTLITLLDSEIGVLLANCRAAGIGGFAGYDNGDDDQGEVTALLQQSHGARRSAESMARHLLHRLDRSHGLHTLTCHPWDDVTSLSHTTSTTSSTDSGGGEGEFGKGEEQRLRDYVLQLRTQRSAVRATVQDLEPLHLDPLGPPIITPTPPTHTHTPGGSTGGELGGGGGRHHHHPHPYPYQCHPDATRLDLENAVLMQELMAMKEERAELKAAHYLLEKESRAQDLRLSAHQSTEAAYRVTIQHLRSELQQRTGQQQETDANQPPVSVCDLESHDPADLARDLAAALTRERSLKGRVQELVATLEKISRNSEVRHKQSAEFVNDLKRANSALITAFDKAKKRYQSKLKKLELQLKSVSERYETQIRVMKQRLTMLEDESGRPPPNETAL